MIDSIDFCVHLALFHDAYTSPCTVAGQLTHWTKDHESQNCSVGPRVPDLKTLWALKIVRDMFHAFI